MAEPSNSSAPTTSPADDERADQEPGLLVSFVWLKPFLAAREEDGYRYRDWVLDSGAFSAHSRGINIDVAEYADTALELMANDPKLSEVYSLDVIGDWRASERNTQYLWGRGVPAIPCYHVGEPEDVLMGLCRDYKKVALGGAVGFRAKGKWARQCFARVWPKALHGFGFGGIRDIMDLPWHSVDATNWELRPGKFGLWRAFGNTSVSWRKPRNVSAEVAFYLRLERSVQSKWGREMERLAPQLEGLHWRPPPQAPSVRLALSVMVRDRIRNTLGNGATR
jgi:hypothetical protein